MKPLLIALALLLVRLRCGAAVPNASETAAEFTKMAVDPAQTYRVRDLQFSRGDARIYLNEGVLSFATPVAGHIAAAVFTSQTAEAGDGELLLLPPQRSERASLALFTKSPNLNEHFHTAVFLFSDGTVQELLSKLEAAPLRKAPEIASENAAATNRLLESAVSQGRLRLMEALFDNHQPEAGFFYGFFGGGELGKFDVLYEPSVAEAMSVGRPVTDGGRERLQLWTAFRPRHAAVLLEPAPVLSDYRLDTTIRPDLSMAAVANFTCVIEGSARRVLALGLSDRLRVKSATVDGKTVEVYQPETLRLAEDLGRNLLLISEAPLEAGRPHAVEVRYEGSVIHKSSDRKGLDDKSSVSQAEGESYFVDERNAWYPHVTPLSTNFDLTFRLAPQLTLVSTGELVSDDVANGVRVVHRRTTVPRGLAGFNLGNYKSTVEEHGPYRVETYANRKSAESMETVAGKTAAVLDYYTKRWSPLPIHSLAVTPIAGTFGQGFPGLIYLSTLAYMRAADRPATLRNARVNTFFSEMMLPHEVAHQWWGNMVIPSDYRTVWLLEAMANYSALQVLGSTQGPKAVDAVLESYRIDLLEEEHGKTLESRGPVDFGIRLLDMGGVSVWHGITYEKGTWILHMLRERLGDEGFRRLQLKLLDEFAAKPVSNEEFRRAASEFVPAGQPDRDLALFFDTWIYGTGIARMSLERSPEGQNVVVSGVDEDFTADVPMQCHVKSGKEEMHWVRVSLGKNLVDGRAANDACELPRPTSYLYTR